MVGPKLLFVGGSLRLCLALAVPVLGAICYTSPQTTREVISSLSLNSTGQDDSEEQERRFRASCLLSEKRQRTLEAMIKNDYEVGEAVEMVIEINQEIIDRGIHFPYHGQTTVEKTMMILSIMLDNELENGRADHNRVAEIRCRMIDWYLRHHKGDTDWIPPTESEHDAAISAE
jgi:hypothetical protein